MKDFNEYDIDCITAMMVVYLHAAERCVQMVELYYTEQQRLTKEYQQLVKLRGKGYAEQMLGHLIQQTFRHDKKWQLSELLRLGKAFHYQMEKLQGPAFLSEKKSIPEGATEEERAAIAKENAERAKKDILRFDDLQRDISEQMYIAAMVYNINEEEKTKILSTLKLYSNKGTLIRQQVIDKLNSYRQ